MAKLPPQRKGSPEACDRLGGEGPRTRLAEITKGLITTVADAKASDADRLAAAKQVIEFRPDDAEAAAKLLAAVTRESSPQFAAGVFEALGSRRRKTLARR